MQIKKIIQAEVDFTKTFSLIAQAYEEIAVMKMRKVRSSVLSTREYLTRLSEVFYDLKKAKEHQKLQESLKQKIHPHSHPQHGKATITRIGNDEKTSKTVSVLLSANTTLYGGLIQKIFRLFMQNVQKDESDIIIVGRVGKSLYEEQVGKKNYLYFELPDVEITLESLKPILFHLVKYPKIMVYYGKFDSIATQQEIVSNISGDQPFAASPQTQSEPKAVSHFLFEPSLDVILEFFEGLIASSLFRQTVDEAQLARWGSRILSMERAQVNIENQIRELQRANLKLQKLKTNREQQELLAGISLWRH